MSNVYACAKFEVDPSKVKWSAYPRHMPGHMFRSCSLIYVYGFPPPLLQDTHITY